MWHAKYVRPSKPTQASNIGKNGAKMSNDQLFGTSPLWGDAGFFPGVAKDTYFALDAARILKSRV